MKYNYQLAAIVGLLFCLISSICRANTYYVCPRLWTYYADNNIAGEDLWTSNGYNYFRGGYMEIRKDGALIWSGYGNSVGCSSSFVGSPGNYQITVRSMGLVNNINICVGDHTSFGGTGCSGQFSDCDYDTYTVTANLQQSGAWSVSVFMDTLGWRRRFNTYMAIMWGLYRNPYTANGNLKIQVEDPNQPTHLDTEYNGNCITVGPSRWDDKFVLTHELGHYIGGFAGVLKGNSHCWRFDEDCPEEPWDGNYYGHTMRSKEWQRSAVSEGFAHFYSAAAWNEFIPNDHDCHFRYYKIVGGALRSLDCASGSGDPIFPDAYTWQNCQGTYSALGYGSELDWMRTFWRTMTDDYDASTYQPVLDLDQICDWIESADDWGLGDATWKLNTAATSIGGSLYHYWHGAWIDNSLYSATKSDAFFCTTSLVQDLGTFTSGNSESGDICIVGSSNYYDLSQNNQCTGWPTPGKEVLYKVRLLSGDVMSIFYETTASVDAALYILDDRLNVTGSNCLDGSDNFGYGVTESLSFTNTSGQDADYYIVLDAYAPSNGCSTYTLTIDP
jgi:hypothetical protein